MHRISIFALSLVFALLAACSDGAGSSAPSGIDFTSFEWTELNDDASWAARAGLHVVELGERF